MGYPCPKCGKPGLEFSVEKDDDKLKMAAGVKLAKDLGASMSTAALVGAAAGKGQGDDVVKGKCRYCGRRFTWTPAYFAQYVDALGAALDDAIERKKELSKKTAIREAEEKPFEDYLDVIGVEGLEVIGTNLFEKINNYSEEFFTELNKLTSSDGFKKEMPTFNEEREAEIIKKKVWKPYRAYVLSRKKSFYKSLNKYKRLQEKGKYSDSGSKRDMYIDFKAKRHHALKEIKNLLLSALRYYEFYCVKSYSMQSRPKKYNSNIHRNCYEVYTLLREKNERHMYSLYEEVKDIDRNSYKSYMKLKGRIKRVKLSSV